MFDLLRRRRRKGPFSVNTAGVLMHYTPPEDAPEERLDVVFPRRVRSVGVGAFADCPGLRSVRMNNRTEAIEQFAFRSCKELEAVSFSGRIRMILRGAFSGCTALRTLEFPERPVFLDERAFSGCTALESIDIPARSFVASEAFAGCTALRSVRIRGSAAQIHPEAFSGCTALEEFTLERLPENEAWISGLCCDQEVPLCEIFCRQGILTAEQLEQALSASVEAENTERTALLLEYIHRTQHTGGGGEDSMWL